MAAIRRIDPTQEYPSRGQYFLKLLLGERAAAMLIGKGGAMIAELETQTSSSIKLGPTGSHYPTTQDRAVVIGCNSFTEMRDVLRQCLRVQRDFGTPPIFARLLAPTPCVPLIIGRGGEIIRSLCGSFGVRIKVQDRVEGVGERMVDIGGPTDSEILDAAMAIAEIIQKELNPAEYASVLYPFQSGNFRPEAFSDRQHPSTTAPAMAGTGQLPHRPAPQGAPTLEVLSFPTKIAFLVPEKCRVSLKECASIEHQLEGVKITLSARDEFDCNVDIEGPLACVQAAHILLIKLVTERLLQEQNIVLSKQ